MATGSIEQVLAMRRLQKAVERELMYWARRESMGDIYASRKVDELQAHWEKLEAAK